MQTSFLESSAVTIVVSTVLLLFFSFLIIYFLFMYQKKRFLHHQEVLELREAFNQTLLQSKLEIQEQTLDHISKELHANFSHLVSLININLAEILPQSSDDMKESVSETKSLAKQLLSELKALSASLNTDHIIHIGFTKALDNELGRLSKTKKLQVTLSKTGDEFRLRPEHEIILFRLCQEVLNNVIQYAQAKNITASLIYTDKAFKLEIKDDGVGFDMEEAIRQRAEKESTGLLNMQKRAKLIDADVEIESEPGKGTNVTIIIPK
ncbi:MAG: putative signal transduction histidine kinase [Mucilaginibacter sp.]|nr:putative signal transduction histidine kinase [Mucilaginibacter sp.]